MIRTFCDGCGAELTEENTPSEGGNGARVMGSLEGKNGDHLKFEVLHAINGVWNGGEVCKYCVIDAVKSADDRPTVPAIKSRPR